MSVACICCALNIIKFLTSITLLSLSCKYLLAEVILQYVIIFFTILGRFKQPDFNYNKIIRLLHFFNIWILYGETLLFLILLFSNFCHLNSKFMFFSLFLFQHKEISICEKCSLNAKKFHKINISCSFFMTT